MSPDPLSAIAGLACLASLVVVAFFIGRRQKRATRHRRTARQAFANDRGWEFEPGPRTWPLDGLKQLKTFEWLHSADANDLATVTLDVGRLVLFDVEWVTPSGASYHTNRELVLRIDGDWGDAFVAESGLPLHERHPETTVEVRDRILALTCTDTEDLNAWVDDALTLAGGLAQNSSS